jgi:hypothetical protein
MKERQELLRRRDVRLVFGCWENVLSEVRVFCGFCSSGNFMVRVNRVFLGEEAL